MSVAEAVRVTQGHTKVKHLIVAHKTLKASNTFFHSKYNFVFHIVLVIIVTFSQPFH